MLKLKNNEYTSGIKICGSIAGVTVSCDYLNLESGQITVTGGCGTDTLHVKLDAADDQGDIISAPCNITSDGSFYCGGYPEGQIGLKTGGALTGGKMQLWGGGYCLQAPALMPNKNAIDAISSQCNHNFVDCPGTGSHPGNYYFCT